MHDFSLFPVNRRRLLAGVATLAASRHVFSGEAMAQPTPPAAGITAELAIAPKTLTLKPGGLETDVISVGGTFPGTVIRAKQGQPLSLTFKNGLDEPTAVQIHGSRGANAAEQMPGLNAPPIAPGASRTINFTPPDAGMFLYWPVLPGKTAEHRERGLTGVLIVDEPDPQPVDLEYIALLDDAAVWNSGPMSGQIVLPFDQTLDRARFGRLGNLLLTNGRVAPQEITVRPNARVRLRLASVANARVMPMKFQGGTQRVIAIDGQACEPFDPLKRAVVLLPGSRYELMLDMPAEAGQQAGVFIETSALLSVLTFKTEGEPLPPRSPIRPLPSNDVPASIRLQNAARSEVAISGGLDRHTPPAEGKAIALPTEQDLKKIFPDKSRIFLINQGYNQGFTGKPVISVKRGSPVVLALTNRTAWAQVLTVHGHVFRLLHPMDDGWEPYFLDTLHLPPMTTSRIAFDASNPGKWAIHSTIAEHYDGGVATWFEVT